MLASVVSAALWGWLTKAPWVVVATLVLGFFTSTGRPPEWYRWHHRLAQTILHGGFFAAVYHYIGGR